MRGNRVSDISIMAAYMKMAGRELPGLRLHFQATGSERSRPAQTYERGFEREI
jgi:hypothetical protein